MEWLDIVDENGQPTGIQIERTEAHAAGIRHRTAHLWLFRRHEGRVQVLLQKRSADKDSYPGCYDISSAGHIPAGQDWISSALRELREELGLSAAPEELHFCGLRRFSFIGNFYGVPFLDSQVSGVYLLWRDVAADAVHFQLSEIESVCWMDFSACVEGVAEQRFENCIREEELQMLARELEKEGIVWTTTT